MVKSSANNCFVKLQTYMFSQYKLILFNTLREKITINYYTKKIFKMDFSFEFTNKFLLF